MMYGRLHCSDRVGVVVLVVVLCGIASTGAHAAALAQLVPKSVTTIRQAVNGTWTVGYKFRDAANAGTYATTRATYSKAAMGALAKGRLINPGTLAAQVAVQGVISGVGWFINEATNQVVRHGSSMDVNPPGVTGWRESLHGGLYALADTAIQALKDAKHQDTGASIIIDHVDGPSGDPLKYIVYWGGGWSGYFDYVIASTDPNIAPVTVDVPVSDEDIADAVAQYAPQLLRDALQDPLTGAVTQTAEEESARQALQDAINASRDADPTNDPTPENTVDISNQDTMDPGDWPVFCEWAGPLCTWLDWTQDTGNEPPTVAIPKTTVELQTFDSGLGAGTCPTPPSFTLRGEVFAMDNAPFCDALNMLRPFLIGVAGIIAAGILVGARGSS